MITLPRMLHSARGCTPLFSEQDADLRAWGWRTKGKGYAAVGGRGADRAKTVFAHRIVLERALGRKIDYPREHTDHINGIKMDCRRENLRAVTPSQSVQNRAFGVFQGARYHKIKGKWEARVGFNGRRMSFGYYATREEAAAVARAKRVELGYLQREAVA